MAIQPSVKKKECVAGEPDKNPYGTQKLIFLILGNL